MQLTRENYFSKEAQMEYTGASQIKAFLKCPACAKSELDGTWKRESTDSLTMGSYLDSMFEGEQARELFELQHPEMFSSRGSTKGMLKATYQSCAEAFERIKSDPVMWDLASNGEQQKILTGELMGVPFKVMFDNLHKDYIVDRKFMASFDDKWSDGEMVNWAEYWGYHYQQALYSLAYEQNYGRKLPFILVAITKEKVPRIGVFKFSDETAENALGIIRANIEKIDGMKKGLIEAPRCGQCDYCASTEKISSNSDDWGIL